MRHAVMYVSPHAALQEPGQEQGLARTQPDEDGIPEPECQPNGAALIKCCVPDNVEFWKAERPGTGMRVFSPHDAHKHMREDADNPHDQINCNCYKWHQMCSFVWLCSPLTFA